MGCNIRCFFWLLIGFLITSLIGGGAVFAAEGTVFEDTLATVIDVRAIGGDLEVELRWNEATAPIESWLRVRDGRGDLVAEVFVVPGAAGETSLEIVPGALGSVTTLGLQYDVTLEGPDGERLSDSLPLRVRLICDASDQCDFETLPGFETERTSLLTPDLNQLLDDLEQEGGYGDLWQAIETRMAANGPSFTYQLDLEVEHLQGGMTWEIGECQCLWTASAEVSGPLARGFGHLIFAEGTASQPSMASGGWSELSMSLRCHKLVAIKPGTAVTLPAGQTLLANRFVLADCPAPCRAVVRQSVDYRLWSWASGDLGTTGDARTDFEFFVDGASVHDGDLESSRAANSEESDHNLLDGDRRRYGRTGRFATASTASIGGDPASHPQAYSTTRGHFDLDALGLATCEGVPAGRAILESRQQSTCCPADIELLGGEEDDNQGTNG